MPPCPEEKVASKIAPKVGDRVRVTKCPVIQYHGRVGTITELQVFTVVEFDDDSPGFNPGLLCPGEFEVITPPAFKPGDYVKLVSEKTSYGGGYWKGWQQQTFQVGDPSAAIPQGSVILDPNGLTVEVQDLIPSTEAEFIKSRAFIAGCYIGEKIQFDRYEAARCRAEEKAQQEQQGRAEAPAFKLGDRVRVLETAKTEWRASRGTFGYVVEILDGSKPVKVRNDGFSESSCNVYDYDELTLIVRAAPATQSSTPETPSSETSSQPSSQITYKFSIGDRVQYLRNTPAEKERYLGTVIGRAPWAFKPTYVVEWDRFGLDVSFEPSIGLEKAAEPEASGTAETEPKNEVFYTVHKSSAGMPHGTPRYGSVESALEEVQKRHVAGSSQDYFVMKSVGVVATPSPQPPAYRSFEGGV